MNKFDKKINIDDFSIESIDMTELDTVNSILPKNGIIDLNIAEQGLFLTLHAQNICQDIILKIDKYISYKEGEKQKAWAKAALDLAPKNNYKTAKDKEWFAFSDDDFIARSNEVALGKATKKWFESRCSSYSAWHYAFKSFLNRDYSIEKLGNFQAVSHSESELSRPKNLEQKEDDFGGDAEW